LITVHHLNNSRSQRIIWLLEELALPYEVKRYERDPKTMLAPPALKAVHPLGKAPVITDGSVTIAESGAIVTDLIEQAGGERLIPPPGTEERRRYTFWLHFAEGSAMPPLVMALLFGEIPKRMPALIRPIGRMINAGVQKGFLRPTLEAQMAFMQAELAKGGWFAGADFTAADVMMSFPVEATQASIGLASHPGLQDWLSRIHDRPAYQAALRTGGPYAYAAKGEQPEK